MTGFLVNVPIAAIDRAAGVVLTMDGQHLPITGWADAHGELLASGDGELAAPPADAPFFAAGPDAYGKHWTVDVRGQVMRVRRPVFPVEAVAPARRGNQAGRRPAWCPGSELPVPDEAASYRQADAHPVPDAACQAARPVETRPHGTVLPAPETPHA